MTGSFATNTFLYYLGSGTYTYSGSTATIFTNNLSLTSNSPSTTTAEENYLTNQLNDGGEIRIAMVNATPASSNATGSASFLGPATTVNGTAAPQLTLDFTTTNVASGSNTSVLAVSGPGTVSSKYVDYNYGRVIEGRLETNTYFLTNTSSVSTDALNLRHEQPTEPVTNNAYPISTATIPAAGAVLNPVGQTNNTGAITVGFAGTDTSQNAIGYTVYGTAYYANVSNPSDPPVTIVATAHVLTERFIDDWSSTSTSASAVAPSIYAASPPSIGNILASPTVTDAYAVTIGTDNGNTAYIGGTDFSTNSLTMELFVGGKTDVPFNITKAFNVGSTSTNVAWISAATPSYNQTFTNTETGVAYAVVTALKSGIYLTGQPSQGLAPGITVTYSTNYGELGSSTGNGAAEFGENLLGESDTSRIYASWSAWQAGSLSANNGSALSPGGTPTLTNLASNDAIYVTNHVSGGITTTYTANTGQRSGARIISLNFNQSQWNQTGWTAGVEGVGTVIAATTSNNSAPVSSTLGFETTDAINGAYGATFAVGLENDQQYVSNHTTGIYGTQPGDLGVTNFFLANTVSDPGGTGAGSYVLTGGTLSVSATTLTGTMNQTGGFSTWGSISGIGSITNTGTGSLLVTNGTTAISSLTGTGTSTIGPTGTLTVGTFSQTSLTNNGNFNLPLLGTGSVGSISGTGTTTVTNTASLSVGNFTQGTLALNGSFNMTGSGTVGLITGAGSVTLAPNSFLQLAASPGTFGPSVGTVSNVGAITLSGSGATQGTLDITNNSLVITYANNAGAFNPAIEQSVRADIINGFDNYTWAGNGITSSIAAEDAATGNPYGGNSAVGYADNNDLGNSSLPNNSVLVRFTYYGDADLNGVVNINDFDQWLYGYTGGTDAAGGVSWSVGDFAYTGHVTLTDFDLWLGSYTSGNGSLSTLDHAIDVSTLSSSQKTELLDIVSSVPEPTSIGLLGIAGFGLLHRRRRKT
ncbi:MAG: PEP-CTERM sorting domain-containing protein [Tepidisphaeraceae bacterium]